ncbi:MAG TPA: MG2 domain-containing protein, partial [Thiobacillaceae bacterium]
GSGKNDSAAVTIPLDEVLLQGRGLALVEVTAPNMERGWRNPSRVLVQATDLGLLAAFSHETVQVLATGLRSGEVVAGAQLELVDKDGQVLAQATSDGLGRASLPIPAVKKPFALIGRHAGNTSILTLSNQINWLSAQTKDIPNAVAYLFTDRGVYRPGEPVQLSALLRGRTPGSEGDLQPARSNQALLVLRDPTGTEVLRSQLATDKHGFAHIEWRAPRDAALGQWYATLESGGKLAGGVPFSVEEYRTPELKVAASLSTELTPPPAGVKATGSVEASYYFGGPVAQQPVSWTLTRTPIEYTPPNNAGFRFGVEQHYWQWRRHGYEGPQQIAGGSATLDAQGRFTVPVVLEKPEVAESGNKPVSSAKGELELDALDENPPQQNSDDSAWTYVFEASVQDANRQSIAGRSSVVAHRALRRVGLRLSRSVLQPKEETQVEMVVVELDGTRVKGVPVTVELVNDDAPRQEKRRCDLTSASEPVTCRLSPGSGGTWRVNATAKDAAGREDRAARLLWVAGGISTSEGPPVVEIIADKERYAPGETARLLVRSPFPRARGLLVIGREGIAATLPLEITDGSTLVELPIREVWLPGVTVQATLVAPRSGPPKEDGLDPQRPRTASGEHKLAVASDSRRLLTGVKLSEQVAGPREPVTIEVSTRSPDGKPMPAQVTVMVVDEAVLAL